MSEEELLRHFPQIGEQVAAAQAPATAELIDEAMRRARALMIPYLRQQMDRILDLLARKPDHDELSR